MSNVMGDLGRRTLGGGLLAVLAAVDIWIGGLAFGLLLAIAAVIMAREFVRLTVPDMGTRHILSVAVWPLIAIAAFQIMLVSAELDPAGSVLRGLLLLAAGAALLVALCMFSLWNLWPAFGVLYIGVPILAFQWLRETSEGHGPFLVAWLVLVIVATDTFAYFAGRLVGGPKLAPRISPGKTWAGLVGGVTAAALTGGLAAPLIGWQWWVLLPLGAAVACLAQAGDLFESWLKRRVGRKDSGSLIPGHGGLLDRLDGYMTATPAFALCVAALGSG